MSVVVFPDDGPSYVPHEPVPARGPSICDNCVHVRYGPGPGGPLIDLRYAEHWTCAADPERIIRPEGIDAITGETIPAQVTKTRCVAKNKRGDCLDFRSRKLVDRLRATTTEHETSQEASEPWKLAPEHLRSARACAGHAARRDADVRAVIWLRAR